MIGIGWSLEKNMTIPAQLDHLVQLCQARLGIVPNTIMCHESTAALFADAAGYTVVVANRVGKNNIQIGRV